MYCRHILGFDRGQAVFMWAIGEGGAAKKLCKATYDHRDIGVRTEVSAAVSTPVTPMMYSLQLWGLRMCYTPQNEVGQKVELQGSGDGSRLDRVSAPIFCCCWFSFVLC